LGIPGFVAYIALWAAFIRTTWRVYTWAPDEETRRLVLGIAAGLLAHQIFGLTDAFMPGTQTRLDNARSHNPSHLFALLLRHTDPCEGSQVDSAPAVPHKARIASLVMLFVTFARVAE